jgi:hypothetical protein
MHGGSGRSARPSARQSRQNRAKAIGKKIAEQRAAIIGELLKTEARRRFPPPWTVDEPDMKLGQDCYIVRDANGHALAYVYFDDEPGRRSAAHLMTREEARRIAASSGPARGILRRIESAGRSAPARTGASGRSST